MKNNAKLDISQRDARVFIEAFSCLKVALQKWVERAENKAVRLEIVDDLIYAIDLSNKFERELVQEFGLEILTPLYRGEEDL